MSRPFGPPGTRSRPRPAHAGKVTALAQIFALVTALIHVVVGLIEAFVFGRSREARLFLTREPGNPPEVRLWTVNVGFYNILLAAAPVAGVIAYHQGHTDVGRALVVYASLFMIAAGLGLYVSDRRLWSGALGQSLPALVTLLAVLTS
ncbi:DUF1304 family protein [Streptomyces sp. OF1]|uniref:DUF1304 family protein n=1 Tax=Streptomyces alkaliterrae TaxID=2213162 RepID=A0A5P0YTA8_9ACTN|nr:DUF1304 family protein [Streptomyces alkaliterrae]